MEILRILWTHIPEIALLIMCLIAIAYGIIEFFIPRAP